MGRLEDGDEVTLSFVPDATPGHYVLVHLGIPVEVLDPAAAEEALALRGESS
jgi:hydrogenase maturation factor